MSRQISMSEIEGLIRDKVLKYGIGNKVDESKIQEIKEKIRNIIQGKQKKEISEQGENQEKKDASPENAKTQDQVVDASQKTTENPNISLKTTEDKERSEIERKKAELELKEKVLMQKELEMTQRAKELEIKEKELSYRPEIPEILKNVPPSSIIIFSENELSAGAENLSQRKFRLADNPDRKVSLHDLWLEGGVTSAVVSIVELKEIGKLIFDPYQGTAYFDNTPDIPIDYDTSNHFGASEKDAYESQIPETPMIDAVEPVKDVTLPIVNPGIEPAMPQVQELGPEFQSMIEKIIQDELLKKNKFSL